MEEKANELDKPGAQRNCCAIVEILLESASSLCFCTLMSLNFGIQQLSRTTRICHKGCYVNCDKVWVEYYVFFFKFCFFKIINDLNFYFWIIWVGLVYDSIDCMPFDSISAVYSQWLSIFSLKKCFFYGRIYSSLKYLDKHLKE